jgi:hypothetical protein
MPGIHGLRWYLLELEDGIPAGFDPFGLRSMHGRVTEIRHVLVWPAPNMPTADVPENFIAERAARREKVPVGVSIGAPLEDLPIAINTDATRDYPYLCSGELRIIE